MEEMKDATRQPSDAPGAADATRSLMIGFGVFGGLVLVIAACLILSGLPRGTVTSSGDLPVVDDSVRDLVAYEPASADTLRDKLFQVGSPHVAAGYNSLYYFGADDTYYYFVSEGECDAELRAEKGTWELNEDKLVLHVSRRMTHSGGELRESLGSCSTPLERIDYKVDVRYSDAVETYTILVVSSDNEGTEIELNGIPWFTGAYSFDDYFAEIVALLDAET